MSGSGSSGHSGGKPLSSSSLAIGAGCGREPGIQALFGAACRPVLQTDVAVVSATVDGLEKIRIVDLAAARLVTPGHVADLHVGDVCHVLCERLDQISL